VHVGYGGSRIDDVEATGYRQQCGMRAAPRDERHILNLNILEHGTVDRGWRGVDDGQPNEGILLAWRYFDCIHVCCCDLSALCGLKYSYSHLSPSLDVKGQRKGRIEMGNHDGENSSRLSYNINLFMNRPPRSGGQSKRR
jgi:hypothetical protein